MQAYYTYHNYYNELEAECKMNQRNIEYISLMTNIICEMFDIAGMSHEYKNYLISQILLYGSAYVETRNDNKFIICGGHFQGIPEPEDIYPKDYIAIKTNFEFNGDITQKENAVVAYMNPQLLPATNIYRLAEHFAHVDTSLVNNIIFSRIAPIISAKNDKVKSAYEEVLDKLIVGEVSNVIKNTGSPAESGELPVTDISNGDYAQKIQYLSMYHDQLLSWFCQLYGIKYNHNSKQANVTNEELHNCDDFCCIVPYMYKTFLNDTLQPLGLSVDFNEPWQWINEQMTKKEELDEQEEQEQDELEKEDTSEESGDEDEEVRTEESDSE